MSNRKAEIPKIIFFFIKERWYWVFPAFFSNIIGSCLSASLLLSIGKYINLVNQESSAKSSIFDSLFGSINSPESMFTFFITLIILKTIFTFLENYLSQHIGNLFTSFIRLKSVNSFFFENNYENINKRINRLSKSSSNDLNSIKELFTKGCLDLTSDLSYLVIIMMLVYSFNEFLFLKIIISLPFFALASYFLGTISSKSKIILNNKRHSIFEYTEHLSREIKSRIMLNSISKTRLDWNKKEISFSSASNRYSLFLGIREASTPFLFYVLIAWILFNVSTTKSINDSSTLSIILLILYAQGPIRRTMRATSIWKTGLHSLNKMSIIKINEPTLNLESIDYKNFEIINKNTSNLYTKGEIYEVNECRNKVGLMLCALGYENSIDPYQIKINNQSIDSSFQLRKLVGVVSEDLNLYGKTIHEILNITGKKLKQQDFNNLIASNEILSSTFQNIHELNLINTSTLQRLILKILRLTLNGRKILLLFNPYENLNQMEINTIEDFLISIKSSITIILIDDSSRKINPQFTQIKTI